MKHITLENIEKIIPTLPDERIIYTGDSFISFENGDVSIHIHEQPTNQELTLLLDIVRDLRRGKTGYDKIGRYIQELPDLVAYEVSDLLLHIAPISTEQIISWKHPLKNKIKLDKFSTKLIKKYGLSEDQKDLIINKSKNYVFRQ